jgi:SpoVK/Ycf46/Vps4 family AAA+-type ATPase
MFHNRKKRNYLKNKKYNNYNLTRTTQFNELLLTLDKNHTNNTNNTNKIQNPIKKEHQEEEDGPHRPSLTRQTNLHNPKQPYVSNVKIDRNYIDNIINIINQNYNEKQSQYTYSTTPLGEIHDPNIYDPNLSAKQKNTIEKSHLEIKRPIPIFEKENIVKEKKIIEAEIDNITDILNLIEKYPLDNAVEYNINMSGLHYIKHDLKELNEMIGMKELKSNIVEQILYFSQGLHQNKDLSGEFLHTVIYGPPGTGKTEIAKIMGKIYSNLGILSKGTFRKVTRSDLVAGYLGQTALKTNDVIKEALGGVLFIDEAYSLGNPEKKDSFSKECIDTLCEALSNHKENLMVIIAGYEEELKESFFSFNKGLDSRFIWRFKTDDYDAKELLMIFIKMTKDIGWNVNIEEELLLKWFEKNKEYFEFFGRDIQSLLTKTKIAHSKRVFCLPENEKRQIIITDLDKGLAMFLKNDNVMKRKKERETKRYIYNTLYS